MLSPYISDIGIAVTLSYQGIRASPLDFYSGLRLALLISQVPTHVSEVVLNKCVNTLIHIKDDQIINLFERLQDEIRLALGRLE